MFKNDIVAFTSNTVWPCINHSNLFYVSDWLKRYKITVKAGRSSEQLVTISRILIAEFKKIIVLSTVM